MRILMLPGDGIGPEITDATAAVLDQLRTSCSLDLTLERRDIGLASLAASGTTLPQDVIDAVHEVEGVILGPVSHYDYPSRAEGGINPSAELRVTLDLFANIRPCRTRRGIPAPGKPMDLVIVRENTEGFYADRNMAAGPGEFMPEPDNALAVRKITAKGSRCTFT